MKLLIATLPSQADLMCMRELLRRDARWRYFLNPAASELPLVTVEEMEATLAGMGGLSVVESNMHRLRDHPLPWRTGPGQYDLRVEVKDRVAEDPPYGLVYRKGEKNVALARDLAAFCIHSQVGCHLYDVRVALLGLQVELLDKERQGGVIKIPNFCGMSYKRLHRGCHRPRQLVALHLLGGRALLLYTRHRHLCE